MSDLTHLHYYLYHASVNINWLNEQYCRNKVEKQTKKHCIEISDTVIYGKLHWSKYGLIQIEEVRGCGNTGGCADKYFESLLNHQLLHQLAGRGIALQAVRELKICASIIYYSSWKPPCNHDLIIEESASVIVTVIVGEWMSSGRTCSKH